MEEMKTTPITAELIDKKGFQEIPGFFGEYDLSLFDIDSELKWHIALYHYERNIWYFKVANNQNIVGELGMVTCLVRNWEDVLPFVKLISPEGLDADSQRDLSRLLG